MSPRWIRPDSLDAVIAELGDDDTHLIAGGVSVVVFMNVGFLEPGRLVSLAGIDELRGVTADDTTLDVGAMCTHAELAADPIVRAMYPSLVHMFSGIGNVRVRAWGTVGGNLVHADPAQDPAVMLTALDARADIVGPDGTRDVAVRDLADGPLSPTVAAGEVVTRIRVPVTTEGTGTSYVKFLPGTKDDYATVSIGARVAFDPGGRVSSAQLAAGSVGPTVIPLDGVEQLLVGHRLEDDVLQALQELVRDVVSPQSDRRGSADYKREMAGIMAQRAVRACLSDSAVEGKSS